MYRVDSQAPTAAAMRGRGKAGGAAGMGVGAAVHLGESAVHRSAGLDGESEV